MTKHPFPTIPIDNLAKQAALALFQKSGCRRPARDSLGRIECPASVFEIHCNISEFEAALADTRAVEREAAVKISFTIR
jgi:hypothetical protein